MYFLTITIICLWIFYNLQKRIGEHQAADWNQWIKDNPQYFKHSETFFPVKQPTTISEDQKKNI